MAQTPTCSACEARVKLARRITSNQRTMFAWLCPQCGASGQKAVPGTQWLSHQAVWDLIMKAQVGRPPGKVRSPFDVVPSLPELP